MKYVALVALIGCSTPTPSLKLELAGPPTQACPSTDCSMVPMTCDTVMSIRIADPNDTTAPYLSQCVDVPLDRKRDVCSIASVDLGTDKIPVRTLEVQVALYPRTVIPIDMNNVLQCPSKVEYDRVWGFPVEQNPTPALGGHAFYHPGDSQVVVTLGCTDLTSINDPSCAAANPITVTATVDDFETIGFSVAPSTADSLTVSVGEPVFGTNVYVLSPANTRNLTRSVVQPIPAWSNDVDLSFNQAVCVDVRADEAQSTETLRCVMATSATHYDLSGVLLKKLALDEILGALQLPAFPANGLTIGIVLDYLGSPVPNFTVATTNGTVQYLSADRKSMFAGTKTSASGVFVSRDAQFGTTFSTAGLGLSEISAIGGQVADKVTIVVLQFEHPATM